MVVYPASKSEYKTIRCCCWDADLVNHFPQILFSHYSYISPNIFVSYRNFIDFSHLAHPYQYHLHIVLYIVFPLLSLHWRHSSRQCSSINLWFPQVTLNNGHIELRIGVNCRQLFVCHFVNYLKTIQVFNCRHFNFVDRCLDASSGTIIFYLVITTTKPFFLCFWNKII